MVPFLFISWATCSKRLRTPALKSFRVQQSMFSALRHSSIIKHVAVTRFYTITTLRLTQHCWRLFLFSKFVSLFILTSIYCHRLLYSNSSCKSLQPMYISLATSALCMLLFISSTVIVLHKGLLARSLFYSICFQASAARNTSFVKLFTASARITLSWISSWVNVL